jgi:hypothetical protein
MYKKFRQLPTASNATRQSQAKVTLRAVRAPIVVTEVRTCRPVAPQFKRSRLTADHRKGGTTPNVKHRAFRILLRKPIAL